MQAVVQVLFVAHQPGGSGRHDRHDVLHQPPLLRRLRPPLLLPRLRTQLPLPHQEQGMRMRTLSHQHALTKPQSQKSRSGFVLQ